MKFEFVTFLMGLGLGFLVAFFMYDNPEESKNDLYNAQSAQICFAALLAQTKENFELNAKIKDLNNQINQCDSDYEELNEKPMDDSFHGPKF